MTPQQQTDLQLWKQDQSQPLPASLENVLIERCLYELDTNLKSKKYFNKVSPREHVKKDIFYYNKEYDISWYDQENEWTDIPDKPLIIQTLLSRTPDGQAVMPFLDVETFKKTYYDRGEGTYQHDYELQKDKWTHWLEESKKFTRPNKEFILETKTTLDHLLYREFTKALRVGKTFDEALKIINLIYCQNAQNKQN
jgi:hypothetical protein